MNWKGRNENAEFLAVDEAWKTIFRSTLDFEQRTLVAQGSLYKGP